MQTTGWLHSCMYYSAATKWHSHPPTLTIYYSPPDLTRRRLTALHFPLTPCEGHVTSATNYAYAEMSQTLSTKWPLDLLAGRFRVLWMRVRKTDNDGQGRLDGCKIGECRFCIFFSQLILKCVLNRYTHSKWHVDVDDDVMELLKGITNLAIKLLRLFCRTLFLVENFDTNL